MEFFFTYFLAPINALLFIKYFIFKFIPLFIISNTIMQHFIFLCKKISTIVQKFIKLNKYSYTQQIKM